MVKNQFRILKNNLADKNSGIWRGKFLERSRHKNPITDKFYNERDF